MLATCKYYLKQFQSSSSVKKHIYQSKNCYSTYISELEKYDINTADLETASGEEPVLKIDEEVDGEGADDDAESQFHDYKPSPEPLYSDFTEHHIIDETPGDSDELEDFARYCESYPEEHQAGRPLYQMSQETNISTTYSKFISGESGSFGPFSDKSEWELASWIIKNTGKNQAESLLSLEAVSTLF